MATLKLNDEQRRAVEHGQGPLLIVAGAGTGKTRVLIERVGHLLRTVKGLQPENILALTFSRKAAAEMRQRAAERFGAAAAGARFSTFHSFCNDLIANETQSRPLDKIDQWIFLRRNLEKLDLDHYFKVSDPGRFLSDLVDFASRCHDNLVTPDEYDAYVDRLEAQGPTTEIPAAPPSTKKRKSSKPPADPVVEHAAEVKRQREVARVFRLLEQMQQEQNYLSYGAMISRAVRLLDATPELAERQRAQYRYILVDEFQDTNTAQFELLLRLAGEDRSLTVVGDDDQAIYRFRGASFASFDQFGDQFTGHERVLLDRNYRSVGSVLAVAGRAISRNTNRYLPDKSLKPAKPHGPQVEVWEFADDTSPARYTAAQVAQAIEKRKAGNGTEKNLDYSSFAVLYRAHSHRRELVAELRERRIPFAIRGLAINDLPVIRDMVAFLRVIGDAADSVSLARVLANFAREGDWRMPPATLEACCRQASRDKSRRLWMTISGAEWPGRDDFIKFVSRCRSRSGEVRLAAWLPLFIADLGLPRSAEEAGPVAVFRKFVEIWDEEKCESGLLDEFLEYFAYFEEAGGKINLPEEDEEHAISAAAGQAGRKGAQEELFAEPAKDVISEAAPPEAEKYPLGRVQLMSVHAAKGLEFDHVFVWNLVRRAFPSDNRKPLIELPPALWKGKLPSGDFHQEEERRLFYVALTRARESLTLVTTANARRKPSIFVDDLRDAPATDLTWVQPIVQAEPPRQQEPEAPPLGITPRQDDSKPFSLSISQLETYLDCPLKYYFSYVLGIPTPHAPAMLFGTAMHAATGKILREVCGSNRELSDLEIEAILNEHWSDRFEDPVQEAKYRKQGLEQLKQLRETWKDRSVKLLNQEKPFQIQLGGCPVAGRIDLVYRNEQDEVELLDFKTGRPKTQKEADEMRQLTLYAEACRRELGLKAQSIALYNLTGQELLHTSRADSDLKALEEEIQQTQQRIAAGSFPAEPGFMSCRNCAYRPICPTHEQPSD